MALSSALELRTGYFHDRASFLALAELLMETFDIDIGQLDRFGGPNPQAMPFGYFESSGRCVANFSAFPMPLVINGKAVRAVGYQSGAVCPAYRGQGLYRDLMRRAFAWAEREDFELGTLLTDKPDLHEPYGFRPVPQHAFVGEPPPARAPLQPARPMSLDDSADIALLRRRLAARKPVSEVFAVVGQSTEFPLNACFDPDIRLSHLPQGDAIIAWRRAGEKFCLLDIVAEAMPSLAEIVGALRVGRGEITVCFPLDKLDWPAFRHEPYSGACVLMMHDMRCVGRPADFFMLSPMAEF